MFGKVVSCLEGSQYVSINTYSCYNVMSLEQVMSGREPVQMSDIELQANAITDAVSFY